MPRAFSINIAARTAARSKPRTKSPTGSRAPGHSIRRRPRPALGGRRRCADHCRAWGGQVLERPWRGARGRAWLRRHVQVPARARARRAGAASLAERAGRSPRVPIAAWALVSRGSSDLTGCESGSRGRLADAGDLVPGQFLDRRDRFGILGRRQGDRDALHPGAAGAADAMDIIVGLPRHVEIDDMADAFDVESARRDVGGDEDVDLVRS